MENYIDKNYNKLLIVFLLILTLLLWVYYSHNSNYFLFLTIFFTPLLIFTLVKMIKNIIINQDSTLLKRIKQEFIYNKCLIYLFISLWGIIIINNSIDEHYHSHYLNSILQSLKISNYELLMKAARKDLYIAFFKYGSIFVLEIIIAVSLVKLIIKFYSNNTISKSPMLFKLLPNKFHRRHSTYKITQK